MTLQRAVTKQRISVNCNAPATAVPSVFRVLWHSASSIQTEQSSPVQSWLVWVIIKAYEQNITRLNTISTIHDIALFLFFDISAHLTLLAFITYSENFYISVSSYRCIMFQFIYDLATDFFINMLNCAAYLTSDTDLTYIHIDNRYWYSRFWLILRRTMPFFTRSVIIRYTVLSEGEQPAALSERIPSTIFFTVNSCSVFVSRIESMQVRCMVLYMSPSYQLIFIIWKWLSFSVYIIFTS